MQAAQMMTIVWQVEKVRSTNSGFGISLAFRYGCIAALLSHGGMRQEWVWGKALGLISLTPIPPSLMVE